MFLHPAYFTFACICTVFACEHYHDPACLDVKPIDGDHFMNQYIAEIKGGEEMAKQVARDTGFEYKKPMTTHDDHYFFKHPDVYDRHKKRHEEVLKILRDHEAVLTADQQFVWRPTIRELEEYEDMVGLEEPVEVRTSYFNPEEIEFEGKTAYELIRPDDVFRDPEPMHDYPPIHTIVDFDKLYEEKNREKEKRAEERRLKEELRKKEEAEKNTVKNNEEKISKDAKTVEAENEIESEKKEKFLTKKEPETNETNEFATEDEATVETDVEE